MLVKKTKEEKTVEIHEIENKVQLLDMVAAGVSDSKAKGPVVVRATLWDGRIVEGSYHKGDKFQKPDAETIYDFFCDDEPLKPLVDRLLTDGESFVTVTGEDDMVCCLEWTISSE